VHKQVVARELLQDVAPAEGVFPSYIRHEEERRARERYGMVEGRA
jgi:acyl-CoA dehydrogenase